MLSFNRLAAQMTKYSQIFTVALLLALLLFFACGKENQVEVDSFSPTGEIEQMTSFSVRFSKELIPDSLVGTYSEAEWIKFTPPLQGRYEWTDRRSLLFSPAQILAPSTEYTAELNQEAFTRLGFSLVGERKFTFFTPRLKVNRADIALKYLSGKKGVAKLLTTLEFNYPVSPQEIGSYLAVKAEDGKDISFQLQTETPDKIIELESEKEIPVKEDEKVKLLVTAGLKPVGGNLGMEQDFEKTIVLPARQEVKVEFMEPVRESLKDKYIRIRFNLPIDKNSAATFLSVEPKISYRLETRRYYLFIKGNFKLDQPYTIKLRRGLAAIDGSKLAKDVVNTVTFLREDIPPQIDFVGDGIYLSRKGKLNLGLSTINIDQVTIQIDKIFANNLVGLLNDNNLSDKYSWYNLKKLGKKVYEEDLTIQMEKNREVVTPIPLKSFLKSKRKGIFNVTARNKREWWASASKWVMITDLGILAKRAGDELWIWVNSLKSLAPIAGVEVKLFSQNNQILGEAQTNGEGIAIISGMESFEKEEFTPYLITAEKEGDLSFLELTRRQISTSDFEVDGAPYLTHGYEAFVYGERGVYRPGETVHLATVVRGEKNSVPAPFPIALEIRDPKQKLFYEQRAKLNEQGAAEFSVKIPNYARTGYYQAIVRIGENEEIGRTEFNIEEFVPDRMKVTLSTDMPDYRAGETMNIDVTAMTLFGPPASGRKVEATIEIESVPFSPQKFKSFIFNDENKEFAAMKVDLGENVLDDKGKFRFIYQVPDNLEAPSSLRAIISATVLEPGGRGVSAYKNLVIHPYDVYVGLRMKKEGYAEPHKNTDIEFIVLNPDREIVANRKLTVSFYHIYWHSILKKTTSYGKYRYVSEQVEELIKEFTVTSREQIGKFSVKPDDYGKYRVVVRDDQSGASSSISFYASGWGYAPWAMDNPDRIEMDLDKKEYVPGQHARIQIRAPFAGKLLLTVEREKIFQHQVVELKENTGTVDVPIEAVYAPNVFVSAHLIRSTESLDRDTPVRAFGVVPLKINSSVHRMEVEVQAPDEIRPKSDLKIKIQLKGKKKGSAYLTIAAVDEGICQLTDFQTPDPFQYFFGKKRLGIETFDIYGMILPEIEASQSSPGGGYLEARRKKHISPTGVTRVKPVAFWSGLIKADSRGRASVKFSVPQFNGTLRIMASTFADDKFGAGEKRIFVRDAIVLTPTFPRFVASGDQFYIPISVYNGTGASGKFKARLKVTGPAKVIGDETQTIQLENKKEGFVRFKVEAGKTVGKLHFQVEVSGRGEKAAYEADVPLRAPVPLVTLSGSGSLREGKPASFVFPKNWLENTAEFSLTISNFPAMQFARSLQYLLRYPHGCIEQTTSRLFPLLYFKDLARTAEPEIFEKNSADYYINEGIQKLEVSQLETGAFSFWPNGDYANPWASIYASHFLVEARRLGYEISDRVYRKMIKSLRNYSRDYNVDERYQLQNAVYACYVLALAGKPERSTMLYFKNSLSDKLSQFSLFQLAGAFAHSGDLKTARELLPQRLSVSANQKRESGGNFNSNIRAKAVMLDVLAEVDPDNALVPKLVQSLIKSANKRGYWGTTQENAFAFLALGKISGKQQRGNYTGVVSIDGAEYEKFGNESYNFSEKDWAGKKVTISIQGSGTCYFAWRAEGIPSALRVTESDQDISVRRRFLNDQGIPLNYNDISQGQLVIAKITLKSLNESLENVAVIDLLPAGFEIENPRLESRKSLNWLKADNYLPDYLDIRDDRLVFYGDLARGREINFYYALRAVTAGTFRLPPARAEAMYNPEKSSVASGGVITIK